MHAQKFLGAKEARVINMKVLYIGCYRDGTGWAQAAIDYILAMDHVGIDVVPRPVKLNSDRYELPERIIELENKSSRGCDVCIQHVLPHMMDYNGGFDRNIALYATETNSFKWSIWPDRINQMDEAWVINNQMAEVSKSSGVNIPITVIPHASDVSKFANNYEPVDIPDSENNFVFYFIGDLNRRKNLAAFVRAFHSEFEIDEPVSIVIKTSKHNTSSDDCATEVKEMCNNVKTGLKLYPSLESYKEDLIITDRLDEETLRRLHAACDCFVMPSYGEAWCIPAFDAMGFGNVPICTDVGGMADFLGGGEGLLVHSREEPVFGMLETFDDLYTANETWQSIDPIGLKQAMRYVYNLNTSDAFSAVQKKGRERVEEYSYESIGNLIKKTLDVN